MEIKVLGPGCPRCGQTEKNVKEAVAEAGVDATIEKGGGGWSGQVRRQDPGKGRDQGMAHRIGL